MEAGRLVGLRLWRVGGLGGGWLCRTFFPGRAGPSRAQLGCSSFRRRCSHSRCRKERRIWCGGEGCLGWRDGNSGAGEERGVVQGRARFGREPGGRPARTCTRRRDPSRFLNGLAHGPLTDFPWLPDAGDGPVRSRLGLPPSSAAWAPRRLGPRRRPPQKPRPAALR
jgi:hypothetical protein